MVSPTTVDNVSYVRLRDQAGLVAKRNELTWTKRAQVIYFYLHPNLGNKSKTLTEMVFPNVNVRTTMKGWLTKKEMIAKWLQIVEKMDGISVKNAVPNKFAERFKLREEKYLSKYLDLRKFKARMGFDQPKLAVIGSGFNTRMSIAKAKAEKSMLILRNATRIRSIRGAKSYLNERNAIEKEVTGRWASGIPITRGEIYSFLRRKFRNGEFHDKFLSSVKQNDKLCNFVSRTLSMFHYCVRKSTVSQSIPKDWMNLAIQGASRVRQRFMDENVDVVIAADETFLRFIEANSKVVVPCGSKRVGTALKCNEKEGCTVMVSMDMNASQLLPPFIIFKGTFGKTLMKSWQRYSKSTVLFTSNHWMTARTNILYLQYLLQLYPNKKIGLIYDHAPSHVSEEVKKWIEEYNNAREENDAELIIEFVDPCLTSVYQPPDVVMNAPLKKSIRTQYHDHVRRLIDRTNITETNESLKAGSTVKISRETLVKFVENSTDDINRENRTDRWIAASFDKCGLNPWRDDAKFRAHLNRLNEDGIYKALTEAHTAEFLYHEAECLAL